MLKEVFQEAARQAGRPALLVLVRHGESMRNMVRKENIYMPDDESAGLIKGTPDHKIALTPKGLDEALATSAPLRRDYGVFDVVYDSGYLRTIQTRNGLLSSYSPDELQAMKIRTNHLIHERLTGFTYDMTSAEVEQYFPYYPAYWQQFGRFYAVPPGGESQEMVCNRVYRFINILFRVRAGKKVLVVTHGGTIRAFRYCLEKWTADDYENRFISGEITNCSVTAYRFNEITNKLELETYDKSYLTK